MNYKFEVTGGFDVKKGLKPIKPFDDIVAFKLPDGRSVRLIVALEIESKAGDMDYKYVTSENEMAELGFECLDYADARFMD